MTTPPNPRERAAQDRAKPEPLRDGRAEARKGETPNQAERLVVLAETLYRFGMAEGEEPFAVPRDGPNVAMLFRGSSVGLRATLAREYRRRFEGTPNASALADALTALEGEAHDRQPERLHLRLARDGESIVIDLARRDGMVVIVRPGSWEVASTSPILFHRTALIGELPIPQRGGSIADLRALLNVSGESWPLTLGWLVAAFIPDIAHPILLLGGEQGVGKSCAAQMLVSLFDPSPAPLRSPPRDPEAWAMVASNSWGVCLDNVSEIRPWFSDALCKAVTGDGFVKRRHYQNSAVMVLSFRRVVALTSIDAGALRGDLGSRLVVVDLERIPDDRRRSEVELIRAYSEGKPRMLGALLDLVASVLSELPGVALPGLPRMADFARVLAAMDRVVGTEALKLFEAQAPRIAEGVVEDDLAGAAMLTRFGSGNTIEEWTGTAGELLKAVTPAEPPRDWPKSPTAFSRRLRRLIPALRLMGIDVIAPGKGDKARRYVVRTNARNARTPETALAGRVQGVKGRAFEGGVASERPDERPRQNPSGTPENAGLGIQGIQGVPDPGFSLSGFEDFGRIDP